METVLSRLRNEFGGWEHLTVKNVVRKINTYTSSRLCGYLASAHRRNFIKTPVRLERWGSSFGGWMVPVEYLPQNALCYCAGVGEDTTFDEKLLQAGHTVYAFDPTPRAIKHVERRRIELGERFHFTPVGIWSSQSALRLAIHADPRVESASVLGIITSGKYLDVECKSVPQIMQEFGHGTPDLLKLDIEGAEYEALKSLLEKSILPRILMIDFDVPVWPTRIHRAVRQLRQRGYSLVAIDQLNYTFLRLEDTPKIAA